MSYRRLAACLAVVVLVLPASGQAETWRTYTNGRFGFRIDYPANLLRMQPPPANNDGRAFTGAGGAIRATASGMFNALNKTGASLFRAAVREFGAGAITYRRRGSNWYAVSGRRGGSIFYEYAAIVTKNGSEVIGRFRITYPAAMQGRMGLVVTRMQRSFARSFRRMPAAN
jgi:hypothetical protein